MNFRTISETRIASVSVIVIVNYKVVNVKTVMHSTLHKTAIVTMSLSSRGLRLTGQVNTRRAVGSVARGMRRYLAGVARKLNPSMIVRTINDPTACIVTIGRIKFAKEIMYVKCTGSRISFRAGCFIRGRLSVHKSHGTLPASFETIVHCVRRNAYPGSRLVDGMIGPRTTVRTVGR